MKKITIKMKRLITLILVVSMIVTAVPQTAMQVSAGRADTESSEEINIEKNVEGEIEDSDNRMEDLPDSEAETPEDVGADDAGNTDTESSDTDTEPSDSSNIESSGEEMENGEMEDEEIPKEEVDDSITEEEEEAEAVADIYDTTADDGISLLAEDDGFEITNGVLKKYTGSAVEITIPDDVTSIAASAFINNTTIQSVTFSDNITEIGNSAFAGCTALKTVVLNKGLTTIGNYAFLNVPFGAKKSASEIETGSLTIPGAVTSIGSQAFKSCTYLEEVIFEAGGTDTLAMGGISVFSECSNLTRVVLPDRLEIIQSSAFQNCTKLEEVTFGTGLKTIGSSAFNGCSSLKSVQFPTGLEKIETYAFQDVPFGEKTGVNNIDSGTLTIPGTVTSIGAQAFMSCTYLGKVIFEADGADKLTIARHGFSQCPNLKSVALPDRLGEIGDSAFQDCSKLEEVTFGTGLKTIGNSAFNSCSSLKNVVLPDGLESIGDYAFFSTAMGEKDKAGSLTIPGTVTGIGRHAFKSCTYLGEVIFINGSANELKMTGTQIFQECPALTKVVLPDRLEELPDATFQDCKKLEQITFGTGLKTIGNSAFNGCVSLKNVVFPDGLETIGNYAFQNVPFGEKTDTGILVIPGKVTSIGTQAFISCTYLGEVIFENRDNYFENLTIATNAFKNCGNLTQVILPDRLTFLDITIFSGCKLLNVLYIPETTNDITGSCSKSDYPKLVIYGVAGTVAETFAKDKGIPFKSKGELDIYVQSISVSPGEIVRAYDLTDEELQNRKDTMQLHVDVKPSTAQNKKVIYRSKDEQVATINDTGVITLMGYGTTKITVTAADTTNEVLPAECEVRVLHKWTEDEKQYARAKLYELNGGSSSKFTLFTNICTNLQEDFPLNTDSENFTAEWRLPYTVYKGENSIYDVVLHRNDYEDTILEDMTIVGVQVDGITIDGSSTRSVKIDEDITLTSAITYSGYSGEETQPALDYEIEWESTKPANARVKDGNAGDPKEKAVIEGLKLSKGNTITAKLVLKKDGEPIEQTKANKGTTWFTAQVKVDVLNVDVANRIVISATKTGNDGESVSVPLEDLKKLTDIKEPVTYNLIAVAYKNETDASRIDNNCPITWSSTDTKVAQVKVQTDGTVVLTIKDTGSATISATAAKNGGYSASFKVTVKDSTPKLESTNVTLNLNLKEPASTIIIRPSDGYGVQDKVAEGLRLLDASEDTVSSLFIIERVSGIEYRIKAKDKDKTGLKTGRYKVRLQVKTQSDGEDMLYDNKIPLTIQVNAVKPKVTVTQTAQTALNLYEKNARGTLQVTSNVEISSITFTSNVLDKDHLEQKYSAIDQENPLAGSLSYGFANEDKIDSTNYTKANAKGTLTVTFKGYENAATYTKTITLKTNNALPKFAAAGITLYPNTTPVVADSALVKITNKTSGKTLAAGDEYSVKLAIAEPDKYKVSDKSAESMPTVQVLSGAKGKTLKFDIRDAGWRDNIKTTVSCSVKIGKDPTVSFSNANVTLNKEFPLYTVKEYKPIEVKPYITGFEDNIEITDLEFTGKDANAKNILNKGALLLKYEDGKIKIGIKDKDAEEFKKTKKYTYQVTANAIRNSQQLTVKGTFTVTVSTAAPSVNLKAGGSIDLANRSGSAITYKITTKNFTDDIKSVSLDDVYSKFFRLEYENGVATVRAKDGMDLKMKTKYPITIKVAYESGAEIPKEVTITPKQNSPKFTSDIKKATLFESAPGESYGQKMVFSGKTETPIEKIELVSGQNAFSFAYDGEGTGTLYVEEDASAKANKIYNLKFAITLKDAATNAAPIYVTVQVKYNK